MSTDLAAHLGRLEEDLSTRRIEEHHGLPDGEATALFTGPAHPPRRLVARRWVHTNGLAFDTRSRSLRGVDGPPGMVRVGVPGVARARSIPARGAPLCWALSPGGPVLAGLSPGPRPSLWIYEVRSDDLREFGDVEVSRSLLGWVEGPVTPMYWTDTGDLLVLAVENRPSEGDADIVRDPADRTSGLDDPELVLAGARVEVLSVRADGTRTTVRRPGAVCHFAPGRDGREHSIGVVPDLPALDRLTRQHRARVEELAIPTSCTAVTSPPARRARSTMSPITTVGDRPMGHVVRQLSADVALHEPADDAEQPLPTVLWLLPLPETDRARRAQLPPFRGDGATSPPGVSWSHVPRCAVATARLWHPRQDESVPFEAFADRVTQGIRAAVDLVREASGRTRLALAGHSFGAALAAVALPELTGFVDCAVLRSGAYNRTLTPGGFQMERRTLWEAPDVYHGFTAVHAASRIRTPTLLLQGSADPNTTTTVLQARLFYESLRLAGVPTRLVLLADEGHQFGTAEGVLRAVREEGTWIDRWCRDEGSSDDEEQDRRGDPVGAPHSDGPHRSDTGTSSVVTASAES